MEKLVKPMHVLLQDEVYVHQIKMNAKHANGGDVWQWHQDFVYWHIEDGMPAPNAISVAIYLDDVTEFNGPMFLIPRTHNYFGETIVNDVSNLSSYQSDKSYMSTLTANLKYTIDDAVLSQMGNQFGIVSSKGRAGSVLLFHANVFHASTSNLSPWGRKMLFVTYNSMKNKLKNVENPRPTFIASRDFRPVTPIADDVFVKSYQKQLI